jgi:hypothetical protein
MTHKTRFQHFLEENVWFSLGLLALALIVVGALWYVLTIRFNVCTPTTKADFDKFKQTTASLDAIADMGIKLSTACVGFGVALLIGLKAGIELNRFSRFFLLVGTIFFIQSALYAVLWRMGVAELWLNDCMELIAHPMLTSRFNAQFYFFISGLASTALIVLGSAFKK